jgi:hypothetical protein
MVPKPAWHNHPVPVLTINEDMGGPSTMSQISVWSGKAASAVTTATNSEFLIKMANSLVKDASKGPLQVRIFDDKDSHFFDLIEAQHESQEPIRVHMIAAALLRAGAPIGEGEDIKDIQKDKENIRKTYHELKIYFTGFNQQMYAATAEAEPTAFQEANSNYDLMLKNPFLGLILWNLITKGASTNKAGKRLDDLRRRLQRPLRHPCIAPAMWEDTWATFKTNIFYSLGRRARLTMLTTSFCPQRWRHSQTECTTLIT